MIFFEKRIYTTQYLIEVHGTSSTSQWDIWTRYNRRKCRRGKICEYQYKIKNGKRIGINRNMLELQTKRTCLYGLSRPQRQLFCYKWGLIVVTSPMCLKCSETRKRSLMNTGESRSPQTSSEVCKKPWHRLHFIKAGYKEKYSSGGQGSWNK